MEVTRRLIDLFFVSVLLDAGAGDHWRYVEPGTEREYERSEGIAVASLYMFKSLSFAAAKNEKQPIVDGKFQVVHWASHYEMTDCFVYRKRSPRLEDRRTCKWLPGYRQESNAGCRISCQSPSKPWEVTLIPP